MVRTEVIIVGAGPTGLMLANELALAGVSVVVLEKQRTRSAQSRAGALQPRTAEALRLLPGYIDLLRREPGFSHPELVALAVSHIHDLMALAFGATRDGTALAIGLVQHAQKPGTMECMAIYQTYRFLTVPKSSLARPYPTHATVALARA